MLRLGTEQWGCVLWFWKLQSGDQRPPREQRDAIHHQTTLTEDCDWGLWEPNALSHSHCPQLMPSAYAQLRSYPCAKWCVDGGLCATMLDNCFQHWQKDDLFEIICNVIYYVHNYLQKYKCFKGLRHNLDICLHKIRENIKQRKWKTKKYQTWYRQLHSEDDQQN
jgi:hypothetical protein